jgi:hypothetical protein
MLDYLPIDIKRHIKSYLFFKCDECENEFVEQEGKKNATTIYYRAIFDDDFPFPRIYKSYKFICIHCIDNLKKDYIKPL